MRRIVSHLSVLIILLVVIPAHVFVSIVSLFARQVTGIRGQRLIRWKSLALHGVETFRWSWWWTVACQPVVINLRYIFLLELADLRGRFVFRHSNDRMLVLQLAHIGDFLVSLPALVALMQIYRTRMTLVVAPWSEALARKALPDCTIEVYRSAWGAVSRTKESIGLWSEYRRIKQLCQSSPSLVIDFGPPWPFDLLFMLMARPARYVGQTKPYWAMFDHAGMIKSVDLQANALETAGRLLDEAGVKRPADWSRASGCSALLSATPVECDAVSEVMRGRVYVCLGVGAGWDGKRWPVEYFAVLMQKITKAHSLRVVFLGAANEFDLAKQVASGIENDCVNLCGETSFIEAIGIIQQAKLMVGNDSALLHMAGLTGTPSVGLFMPGNAAYWNPEGSQHRAIEAAGACPCMRYPVGSCRQPKDPCMRRIPVDAVMNAVEQLLGLEPRLNTDRRG